MYYGEEGTIRIQREPIHIHDDLQRISFIDFLKRIHVSLNNTSNNKSFFLLNMFYAFITIKLIIFQGHSIRLFV